MTGWQVNLLIFYSVLALAFFLGGVLKSLRGKAYQKFLPLNLIGGFVWGDAVVFGLFWLVAVALILLFGNWRIFLITFLSFWLIRSLGETIYWFNQQFSTTIRTKPQEIWFYRYFKNDAVYFIYQIFWQTLSVIALVLLLLIIFGPIT